MRKAVRFQSPQERLNRTAGQQLIPNAVVNSVVVAQPTLEVTCRGHRGCVTGVSFEQPPSLSTSSVTPPKVASSSLDGTVALWDANITHRSLRNTGHHSPVLCCEYSARALGVVSGDHNGYGQLWLPNLRRTACTYPATWSLGASASDSDGLFKWKAHSGAMRAVAFAQDGSDYVYTAGDDKAVKCWDLNYLHCEGSRRGGNRFVGSFSTPSTSSLAGVTGHTNWIHCIALQGPQTHSSYFHLMASGGDDRCVFLWDVRTQRCADVIREVTGSVRGLSFHPSGYAIACGDAKGAIQIYDLRHVKTPVSTLVGSHTGGAPSVSRATTSPYHTMLQMYPTAHVGAVNDVQFSLDGSWLISVGEDGNIHVWDAMEGHLYCTLQAHNGPVRACCLSSDGRYFATGGYDQSVLVWRLSLPAAVPDNDHHPVEGVDAAGGLLAHKKGSSLAEASSPVVADDEDDEPQPFSIVPPPTAAAAVEEMVDHKFRRSEERLDFPPTPTCLPREEPSRSESHRGRSLGADDEDSTQPTSPQVEVIIDREEQHRLKSELHELQRAVSALSASQLQRESQAVQEVERMRGELQAIQLRQQQEMQELRGLLVAWMTAQQQQQQDSHMNGEAHS